MFAGLSPVGCDNHNKAAKLFQQKIEASGPEVKRLSESAGTSFNQISFFDILCQTVQKKKPEGVPRETFWFLYKVFGCVQAQPSMVEMPRVVSSSTSSRTRTVSRAVKTLTLFSTAHWRMAWPSDNRSWSLTSRVLIT